MHEAVGIFNDMQQLQLAIKELERTEFPRDSLSILGHHEKLNLNSDRLFSHSGELDEKLRQEAPVRSEEKTIGASVLVGGAVYVGAMAAALAAGAVAIPAIIAAAVVGGAGGGAVGGVLANLLGDHYDKEIEDQIKAGGLLLWVRTPDEHKEKLACEILTNYGAKRVRIQKY